MKTPTIAALRGQLLACQRIMERHRAAMAAIKRGESPQTTPLSERKASNLARQIEDLRTRTAVEK